MATVKQGENPSFLLDATREWAQMGLVQSDLDTLIDDEDDVLMLDKYIVFTIHAFNICDGVKPRVSLVAKKADNKRLE